MVHHQLTTLTLVFLALFPLTVLAQNDENDYEIAFVGRRLCCDNVWPNGNCPDYDTDFNNTEITGATTVLQCKHTNLATSKTYKGWIDFHLKGNKNPILKYDMVKECRIIVTDASGSDCPDLSVPLVSNVTGLPVGMVEYPDNGDFVKYVTKA